MSRRLHNYEGKGIEVTYDVRRCIHAAECVRRLPRVFDPNAKPWVQPDQASAEEVYEVVCACPTGALQARLGDGEEAQDSLRDLVGEGPHGEAEGAANLVTLAADGPVYARGDLRVLNAAGEEMDRDTRVALCRCGASKIKPFCDGSHAKAEFVDTGELGEVQVRGSADEGETLEVRVTAAGPLVLSGSFELRSVGGSSCHGSSTALCRCGASANRPFCDGSHVGAGFEG